MMRVLWLVALVGAAEVSLMSREELEDFRDFLLKTSQLDLQVKKGADPDYNSDENEIVSDHAWEESGKFEGDLILNDRQRRLIVENVEGLSRNGLTDSTKKWPNNEVIYFIQREHFNGGQVQAIREGIDDLAQASCVKFRPYRKGDRDAVVIQGSRPGCFSQVGYQGGYQVLNLSGRHPVGRGCFRHGTVVHELLHSLGFYHMQSSPDRDDYINVVWANIVQPARHNFRKYNSFSVSDFGVGYDYDSVLHYSRKAFSANGQDTLVPKQRGAEIGQRVGLSDKDTQKLNRMYCDANSDHVEADDNADQKLKNKKKKPKNQPFQGHGIGYHQGKTLVIKLPVAQAYKLSNVPSTSVFDFSKTPQVVSTPESEGYRFGKEVTYLNNPTSLNGDTPTGHKSQDVFKPSYNNDSEQSQETTRENPDTTKDGVNGYYSDEVKPEYVPIDEYDKDLKESFDRLSRIVMQHVYPQSQGYDSKINKDYSRFYSFDPIKSERFEGSISYVQPLSTSHKNTDIHQIGYKSKDKLKDEKTEDKMDSSYRTLLPRKKPYSYYTQTDTPEYASLEYLKDRHDFSDTYSPISSEDDRQGLPYREEQSNIDHLSYYNEDTKKKSGDRFYTDMVEENTDGHIKDAFKKENSKEIKMSNAELAKNKINKNLKDRMDSSYRTLFSIPKYNNYSLTETPDYTKMEHLKDRHDFSSLYLLREINDKNRNGSNVILNENIPLTHINYDEDFNTEIVKQSKGESNERLNSNDQADERSTGTNNAEEYNKYNQDTYIDHDRYKNEEQPVDFYKYSNGNRESNENISKSKKNNVESYYNNYEDEDNENSKEFPKKSKHYYTLYGVPVPVSNDWYKPSYVIPTYEH